MKGKATGLKLKIYKALCKYLKAFCLTYIYYYNKKRGRKPKIEDWEIAAAFITCYLDKSSVLKFLQLYVDDTIRSWNVFRKNRIRRVYKILRKFMLFVGLLKVLTKLYIEITASIIFGKVMEIEEKLVVDGTILDVANVNRARTQRIKRLSGKSFWVRRKRKLYSVHYKKKIEFEELHYGILAMVLADLKGIVLDIWYLPASVHENKALKEREEKSLYLKTLLGQYKVLGDKAYKGNKKVEVCNSKPLKALKQIIETTIGGVKGFFYSRWRKGITLLTYLYGLSIGFSFLRFINALLKLPISKYKLIFKTYVFL